MKIITNHKVINNRKKIGGIASTASLVFVVLGLVFMFQDGMMIYSTASIIIGFIGMQIGVFMGNRWGSKVQPHKRIEAALKGLDNKYTLYNYITGAPHLLVGPAGVYHFITYHQPGQITYDEGKGRWKQKGGNAYLKIFAQDSLGRPDLDVEAFSFDLEKYLKKKSPDLVEKIKPQPILLFLNEKASVDAKDAPVAALVPEKLKDFIRKQAKNKPLDMDLVEELVDVLPKEDVTK